METLDTFIGRLFAVLFVAMMLALACIPFGLLIHGLVTMFGGMVTIAVLLFVGSMALLLWAIE